MPRGTLPPIGRGGSRWSGLRGAGKSTLGARLAEHLGCPFIELDRLVEQDYGARIPDLIEIAGLATFRRYERACLERVIAGTTRR